VRHWEQDLQIAILDASPSTPLSVVYLDMNGLKTLNDQYGHDAGDRGLRAYFQAVASVLGDAGQAYRLGGDEVLMVLPAWDTNESARIVEVACRRLMSERLNVESIVLSMAAGVVCVNDSLPTSTAVRTAADTVQRRAKEESRKHSPRPGVIAIDQVVDMKIIPA
jgi:diguanylate cyclase (GGDEF)-like protein